MEVVRGLFEAFNRRDLEGQLELLSEDYEWHPAFTGGGLVEGSVYHGREGFKRYWREQAETWAEIKLEVEELRDLGHRVLALAHIHALGRVSGLEVDQRFGGIWTFRGAELVEGRAYRTGDVAHAPHRRPRDLTLRVAALTLRARALASRRGGSVAPCGSSSMTSPSPSPGESGAARPRSPRPAPT
ncbi:MAG: nuclear transport factor 2 family protein [Solirubrobacteraceae bacterium]